VIPVAALKQPTSVVRETMRIANDKAALEVTSTYRGAAADDMRYTLSRTARSKTKSQNLEFYAKRFEGIEATADLVVEDDEKKNVLVTRELYTIPDPVKAEAVSLWAYSIANAVSAPTVKVRTSPLDLGPPSFVRHEIVIEGLAVVLPEPASFSDGAVAFTMKSETRPSGGTVTYELQTLTESVAVAEVPKHLETLSSIRDALDENAHLPSPVPAKPPVDEKVFLWVGLGFAAFFVGAIVIVIGAVIAWAAGRRLRWRPVGQPGP
jgi:hypothetical protein